MKREKYERERAPITTGCVVGLLYALGIIALSAALTVFGWNSVKDVMGLLKDERETTVVIPENYTLPQVAKILKDAKIVDNSWLFSFFADFSHAEGKIVPGEYTLRSNLDYHALINAMKPKAADKVTIRLTITEGMNLRQIIRLLSENDVAESDELWDIAETHMYEFSFLKDIPQRPNRLEGYLYPDTYDFFIGESPVSVFNKMLLNFSRKFTKEYRERADELGYSVNEIITIAAMVEKEAADDDERGNISSVIYNRLTHSDQFPTLGIDATIQYLLEAPKAVLSEADLSIDSPYNTRIYPGLPPGPIASPGQNSIRAALYPETTNFYYYVLSPEGHIFCKTASEFEKAKEKNKDYLESLNSQ